MKLNSLVAALFLGLLFFGLLVYVFITANQHIKAELRGDNACLQLGCSKISRYVASRESELYHNCSCFYAKRISKNNLICFESRQQAEQYGFKPCSSCIKQ